MSESPDIGESSTGNQNAPFVKRRGLLQAIGISGAFTVGLNAFSSDVEADVEGRVSILDGDERGKFISEVLKNRRVNKLLSSFQLDGFHKRLPKGKYFRVNPDGAMSYRAAVIPFTKNSDSQENSVKRIIIHIDKNIENIIDDHRAAATPSTIGYEVGQAGFTGSEITVYKVNEEHSVISKVSTSEASSQVGTQEVLPPPGGSGCSDGRCLKKIRECDGIDEVCWASIAVAGIGLAAAAGSCSVCAGSFGILTKACVICFGAITGGVLAGLECSHGFFDHCEVIWACAPHHYC